jgi:hypothetical protein
MNRQDVLVYFNVVFHHSLAVPEKGTKRTQSNLPVSPSTSKYDKLMLAILFNYLYQDILGC